MKKDRDFIHWKLWRFSVDWFTDCGDWFLYFRYRKHVNINCGTYTCNYEFYEIRFSSAGFMVSNFYDTTDNRWSK